MKIFSFRKKTKLTDEISKLRGLLERNPGDTEIRVRLADLHVRVGDQESAVKELQTAAKRLSDEELVLGTIGIYKRILSLKGISLTKEALALLEEADKLLVKALKIYEEVSQIRPQDEKARAPSEASHQDHLERIDDLEEVEIPDMDDSEPVDIEMLLAPSEDQGVPEMRLDGNPEEHSPDQERTPSLASPSVTKGADYNLTGGSAEFLDTLFASLDKDLDEVDIQEPDNEHQITAETDSSYRKNRQADLTKSQIDDNRTTILPPHKTSSSTENSLPQDVTPALADEDLIDTLERQLEEVRSKRNGRARF